MTAGVSALLLLSHADPLGELELALQELSVKTSLASSCREANRVLAAPNPPELIFTATELPDGNWVDVLRLAERACAPVNVIVVSRLADVRFYIEVIEAGAFDYIVPPFESTGLAHVVCCATGSVLRRRNALAQAEQAGQPTLPLSAIQS
jgi:DNA-binding NtrC family response regulator